MGTARSLNEKRQRYNRTVMSRVDRCWHHTETRHPGTADATHTGERACRSGTGRHALVKHAHTCTAASSSTKRTRSPASKPSRHHAETLASQHSKCSAQARASGLAGAEGAKTHSPSTRNTPRCWTWCSGGTLPRRLQVRSDIRYVGIFFSVGRLWRILAGRPP